MDIYNEVLSTLRDVLRSLGRIEGEQVEIRKLSERVRKLEIWQACLKGVWAAVMAVCAYLLRVSVGK